MKGLNASFIALIPKSDNPIGLRNYRPISLIGSVYKILSNVLASRMKKVIAKVVGEVQAAFVGGRGLQGGVFVANEIVDFWRLNKKKGIVLKLDFQKAYDSISWSYMFDMMRKFGFDGKWEAWVKECVVSASVSVLDRKSVV